MLLGTQCTLFGGTYTKIGTIQRRLAWPLRKDDTQIREAFHIFVRRPVGRTAKTQTYVLVPVSTLCDHRRRRYGGRRTTQNSAIWHKTWNEIGTIQRRLAYPAPAQGWHANSSSVPYYQDPDLRVGTGLDPVRPPAAEMWLPPYGPKFGPHGQKVGTIQRRLAYLAALPKDGR